MPDPLYLNDPQNDPLKFFIKRNDTDPPLRRTLIDPATGEALDLTGASVEFVMNESDLVTPKIRQPAVIEDVAGIARYNWNPRPVWTKQTLDGGYNEFLVGAAYKPGSPGLFLVCGVNTTTFNGEIQTSPDGVNWTQQSPDPTGALVFSAAAYGSDLFVVVGLFGKIQTSPDGVTWTSRTAGGGYTSDFQGVEYANGLFVAVGVGAGIQTSPDGITWTKRTAAVGFTSWFLDAAYGSGLWVIVGRNGEIETSPDGITWTKRTAGGGFTNVFSGVVFGNDQFVAVGAGGEIQTSPDGITWTPRDAAENYSDTWQAVTYGNGMYVASGSSGEIQISRDGINWERVIADEPYEGSFTWGKGAFGDSQFILCGNYGYLETGELRDTYTAGSFPAEFRARLATGERVTYPGGADEPSRRYMFVDVFEDLDSE